MSSSLVAYAKNGTFGVMIGSDVTFTSRARENGISWVIPGVDVKFASCARENGISGIRTWAFQAWETVGGIFGGESP